MKSWKRTLAPSPARLQTSASHTSFISSVEDSSICMTGLRYEDAKLTSHIEVGYLVLTVRMGPVIVCEIFRHLQLWCQLLRTKMLILRSVANLTALSSILFWHFSYFSYESVVFNLIHLTIKKVLFLHSLEVMFKVKACDCHKWTHLLYVLFLTLAVLVSFRLFLRWNFLASLNQQNRKLTMWRDWLGAVVKETVSWTQEIGYKIIHKIISMPFALQLYSQLYYVFLLLFVLMFFICYDFLLIYYWNKKYIYILF